jgi:hypothetical protein
MKKALIALVTVFCLTGCKQQDQASPRTFLIPQGYIGWVTVHNDNSAEARREYTVDEKGHVLVNEKNVHDGWAANKYFYINDKGDRTEITQEKMIHGASSGNDSAKNGEAHFFVGDKKQFEKTEYSPEEK